MYFILKRLVGRKVLRMCAVTKVFMGIAMDSFKNYSLLTVADLFCSFSLKSQELSASPFLPLQHLQSLSGMWKIITFTWWVVYSVIQI